MDKQRQQEFLENTRLEARDRGVILEAILSGIRGMAQTEADDGSKAWADVVALIAEMIPDRADANQKANMENTSQEINKKIEQNIRDLEATQILIAIGKGLDEPYTFKDIDKLIMQRVEARRSDMESSEGAKKC